MILRFLVNSAPFVHLAHDAISSAKQDDVIAGVEEKLRRHAETPQAQNVAAMLLQR